MSGFSLVVAERLGIQLPGLRPTDIPAFTRTVDWAAGSRIVENTPLDPVVFDLARIVHTHEDDFRISFDDVCKLLTSSITAVLGLPHIRHVESAFAKASALPDLEGVDDVFFPGTQVTCRDGKITWPYLSRESGRGWKYAWRWSLGSGLFFNSNRFAIPRGSLK